MKHIVILLLFLLRIVLIANLAVIFVKYEKSKIDLNANRGSDLLAENSEEDDIYAYQY